MSTYTPAAVASDCDSLSHRIISTNVELDHVVKTVDPGSYKLQQLLALSGSLSQLRDAIDQFKGALLAASVVSQPVQSAINVSVQPCSDASAVVEEQIHRLGEGLDIDTVDVELVSEYATHQSANARLFTLLAEVLPIPRQDAQEAKFTALSGRQALDRGVETSARVLERAHIPLGSQEVSPNEGPPPEYSQGAGRGKQKDSDGFFASLSHSFKAMTANLRPKPDPIVIVTCESAEAGHINHLQGFITHGVNINGHNEDGYTPLICAVRANQVEAVRLLLSAGADLSTQDSHRGKRKPALFHAAECGHLALAELLMDAGASMRARSYWSGQPHFVEVVESSKTSMIKLFLEKGADPNMCAISGRTVFIHAIRAGNMEHVRLLQKYGGDVNARDITGLPALHMALGKNRMDMVDFLLQQGADANVSDLSGNSMLHVASSRKNYELVRKLLHRGANPNTSDYLGRTLLGKLVDSTTVENSPDADLALMLLERGADANQCDSWGEKLLYHVLVKGNTSLLKGFLKHRANVNSPFRSQETPLLYTLAHGQLHHTRLLLNHGADPNMRNGEGKTPLMEALLQNDTELVQELLSRGADINAGGNVKPAALAKILSNPDIVRLLVQKGADGPTRLPSLAPNGGQAAAPDETQSPNTSPGGAPGAVAVDEALPPYAPPP